MDPDGGLSNDFVLPIVHLRLNLLLLRVSTFPMRVIDWYFPGHEQVESGWNLGFGTVVVDKVWQDTVSIFQGKAIEIAVDDQG